MRLRPELIGVGGTLTSLAAMKSGITVYDPSVVDGCILTKEDLSAFAGKLSAMTESDIRKAYPVLPDMRCGLITAGAILAEELLTYLGAPYIKVSESDNLDGFLRYKHKMTKDA